MPVHGAPGGGERSGDAAAQRQRGLSGEVTAQRGRDASGDEPDGVHGAVERAGAAAADAAGALPRGGRTELGVAGRGGSVAAAGRRRGGVCAPRGVTAGGGRCEDGGGDGGGAGRSRRRDADTERAHRLGAPDMAGMGGRRAAALGVRRTQEHDRCADPVGRDRAHPGAGGRVDRGAPDARSRDGRSRATPKG